MHRLLSPISPDAQGICSWPAEREEKREQRPPSLIVLLNYKLHRGSGMSASGPRGGREQTQRKGHRHEHKTRHTCGQSGM